MLKITFRLPRLETEPQIDRKCRFCGYERCHIHGYRRRGIKDYALSEVVTIRMKCPKCRKVFTIVPRGVTYRRHRSDRVVGLGIMLYYYGLSYQSAWAVLVSLGINQSVTTVYNDFIEACDKAMAKLQVRRKATKIVVKIGGCDGAVQKLKGKKEANLLFFTDLEEEDAEALIEVYLADERNPEEVKEKVEEVKREYGIEAIMTDGHKSYNYLDDYEKSRVRHLRCQAHFKKAKIIRIRELLKECREKGYKRLPLLLKELEPIVKNLGAGSKDALDKLFNKALRYKRKRYPSTRKTKSKKPRKWSVSYRIYKLITEVHEKLPELADQEITTNNGTERQIGLNLKIRSKLMRGFWLAQNVLRFTNISRYFRRERIVPLEDIV